SRLVLIDFGLSRQYNPDGTTDSEIVAAVSKGYAPPEQYAGVKRFSPESDIYSLGATYYKLITGETPPEPFDISENPELLSFPPGIPEKDIDVITAAMEPERNKRLSTAREFIDKLGAKGTAVNKSGGGAWPWILNVFLGALVASGLYVSYLILLKRSGKVAYEFYLGYDIYEVSKAGFAACMLTGVAIGLLAMKASGSGRKFVLALIAAGLIVSQIYYSI
ncbi:MAG: protein kinase, partial [Muribaculaceae bacterium]|nr:protein kinase [Muribaculaceae bacterium]